MVLRSYVRAWAGVVCAIGAGLTASAQGGVSQGGVSLTGRVSSSLTGEPVASATLVLEELRRETASAADGSFAFHAVPPGEYHIAVRAEGFSSRRTEVVVGTSPVSVEITADPELHFEEVVSVSPNGRGQFESFQPTSVLAGQDLTRELAMTVGETLQNQPGVAVRSFGPAPARPVIRGLDGDRVLILQDGQRLGDLSSQSGDHGVPVNPAAAQRIEVIRGPATLLYGANAIGGLVNVITDQIPEQPQEGVSGNATLDLGSAASEAAGAADVHVGNGTLALHAGGGGRRSDDVDTPAGAVENSQSRTGFGNVGLAWTGSRGYLGASYGYDDTRYGIPVVESGVLELTPRRHAITVRGAARNLHGAFEGVRATLAHRRYRHEELEGTEVGTRFTNDTTELELMGSHRALGRLSGSVGGWVLGRAFDAQGEEALSPAVDQQGFAAFLYEEATWPHITLQAGARVDHVRFQPAGEPERRFTNPSVSAGVLFRPARAEDKLTLALSVARTSRNPALEELFFFGLHHGNFAFEVGNPDLESEKALGVDLSLRWRSSRVSGEVTYFRNGIGDYIFRRPLSREELEAREDEFAARFPGRDIGHEEDPGHDLEPGVALIEYVGADSVLQGIEAHADVQLGGGVTAELGMDYVRGTLQASGDPLPRMPPFRFRGALRYQRNAFQAGSEIVAAGDQRRVSGAETPTAGYGVAKLFASYSFQTGNAVSTVTARADNLTNTLYRNHLSLIKDLVPEMGRNFKLLYNVKF